MELIVKFIFSEDWDNDYKNIDAELIAEDAIRELAEGVGYEIIDLKRGSENSSDENAALTLHDVNTSSYHYVIQDKQTLLILARFATRIDAEKYANDRFSPDSITIAKHWN